MLGLGWIDVIATFWVTDPNYYKPVPEKRHTIVPLTVAKVTMLDPFL